MLEIMEDIDRLRGRVSVSGLAKQRFITIRRRNGFCEASGDPSKRIYQFREIPGCGDGHKDLCLPVLQGTLSSCTPRTLLDIACEFGY